MHLSVDNAVYSHLFIGSRAQTNLADIELETGYPWNGGAKYTVHPHANNPFSLMMHVPGYVQEVNVLLNGEGLPASIENGYLRIERIWQDGDCVELRFALMPRRIYSDPRVEANAGCVALAKGPFIYCFEGVDNGEKLSELHLAPEAAITAGEFNSLNVQMLTADDLVAIPYFAWSNRGINEMRVWMHE